MKKLNLLALSGALSISLLSGSSLASGDDRAQWRHLDTIVGAWQVEFTLRVDAPDCTTAELVTFPPNPFPALSTFHEGGTVSETGSRSPPSMRSPGHGVWKQIGRNRYQARYTFQSFDANGLLVADMDISSNLKLSRDGSRFNGVSRLTRTDLSGNVFPFCVTLKGVRYDL